MEDGKIYLALTTIGNDGKASTIYGGEHEADTCLYFKSCVTGQQAGLIVPLWFRDMASAEAYIKRANDHGSARDFWLVQEFSYQQKNIMDEAKIVFHCKSDDWPTLDEGRTERSPGVWARVRSFFVCDREAAEDYVRRFNGDSAAALDAVREAA